MAREKKSVWVVTVWECDDDDEPYSYIWEVCATEELAEKAASKWSGQSDICEYEVKEGDEE